MRCARWLLLWIAVLGPVTGRLLAQTVACSSDDGQKHYCAADTRYGARLVQQKGTAPCTEGKTWGFDEEGIWVDKGCAGEFALGRSETAAPAPADAQMVTCSSENGARKYCPIPTRGGVTLVKKRSDAACIHGSSWGFDDKGVWVNRGCSADFVIGVPSHPEASGPPRNETVSCISDDGRRNYCEVDLQGAKVQLTRQLSSAPCQLGSSWGYDKEGIWVDRGCRGDFLVTGGPTGPLERSCTELVGKQKAKEYVEQCKQVSPGTHPPCNAKNTCELITDEIRRRCQMIGASAPAFCGDYK